MIATINSDPRLLAYLPLNGNTADHSARHNIGTNTSMLYGSDGFANYGIFNGTSSYVTISNPTAFNFGTADFTISCWINSKAIGSALMIFTKTTSTGWATSAKQFFVETDGSIRFDAYNVATAIGGTLTKANRWYHVAVTFADSPNTCKIYVNGKLDGQNTLALTADSASHVMRIGRRGDGLYFNGYIRDFRVYNKTLQAEEVLRLYNQGLSKSTNRLGFLNTISAVIQDINSFFQGW